MNGYVKYDKNGYVKYTYIISVYLCGGPRGGGGTDIGGPGTEKVEGAWVRHR